MEAKDDVEKVKRLKEEEEWEGEQVGTREEKKERKEGYEKRRGCISELY